MADLNNQMLIGTEHMTTIANATKHLVGTPDIIYGEQIPDFLTGKNSKRATITGGGSYSSSVTLPCDPRKISFICWQGGSSSYGDSGRAFIGGTSLVGLGESIVGSTGIIYTPLVAIGAYGTSSGTTNYTGLSYVGADGLGRRLNYSTSYMMYWWYLRTDPTTMKATLYYTNTQPTAETGVSGLSSSNYMLNKYGAMLIIGGDI